MQQPTTLDPARALRRARPRSGSRAVPQRSPEHAHLSLPQLRTYRAALADEEGRVSYWRRIVQGRLDLMRAGATAGSHTDALRPALATERVSRGRQALVEAVPVDDIPPLPDLAGIWHRASEPDAGPEALEELAAAERELSAYRAALHRRLDAATGDLIARYRDNPRLCLSILPVEAESRAV